MRHSHVEDGEKLGVWLANNRNRRDTLDAYRAEKLEEYFRTWIPIRPDSGAEPDEERWEDMLNLLLQFKEREGHLDVPKRHKEDGENLGVWLSWQRSSQKRGVLDEYRENRLNDIGVSWDLTYLKQQRWEDMYDLLVQFKEREGHPNVPEGHVEDGETLGVWVKGQRVAKKKGVLEADRREELENLGFAWELRSRIER